MYLYECLSEPIQTDLSIPSQDIPEVISPPCLRESIQLGTLLILSRDDRKISTPRLKVWVSQIPHRNLSYPVTGSTERSLTSSQSKSKANPTSLSIPSQDVIEKQPVPLGLISHPITGSPWEDLYLSIGKRRLKNTQQTSTSQHLLQCVLQLVLKSHLIKSSCVLQLLLKSHLIKSFPEWV